MNTMRNRSVFPLFEGVRGSLYRGILLLLLFFTLSLQAQVVTVYHSGKPVYSFAKADSIVFHSLPDHTLPGAFSVSATRQVQFSQGNLQYTQSTQTWSFATNQYDIIGIANLTGTTINDKTDLFGWSGSTGVAQWGISTSTDNSDYSGDFADWGTRVGDGQTWYTLTLDEWTYLLTGRANADALSGVARINLNADGTEYANGLVLLPDYWACPADVIFKSGFADNNGTQHYAGHQTFTLADWQKLEGAGAVFLPAAGNRTGSDYGVYSVQEIGSYWSATPNDASRAHLIYFSSGYMYTNIPTSRYTGFAVRLVRDL